MLERDDIAGLIPHGGDMVLLDRVEEWSDSRIVCSTRTHRRADNPLRRDGALGAAAGIEYGAQAIALHGGLIAGGDSRRGLLASLRDVRFTVERLDDIDDALTVSADLLMHHTDNAVYGFAIDHAGRPLVSGRATVILR